MVGLLAVLCPALPTTLGHGVLPVPVGVRLASLWGEGQARGPPTSNLRHPCWEEVEQY